MKTRTITVLPVLAVWLAMSAQNEVKLTYWFDNLPPTSISTGSGNSVIELDASALSPGLHTLAIMAENNGRLSSPRTSLFVKGYNPFIDSNPRAVAIIDGEVWESPSVTMTADRGTFLIDVNRLEVGVHTLSTALIGSQGETSDVMSSLFLRTPTSAEMAGMQAYYIVDDNSALSGSVAVNTTATAHSLNIDMSNLASGLHSISVSMVSPLGFATVPIKSFFIKIPNGGEGVKGYRYWVDNDKANLTEVMLETPRPHLPIVKMIDVAEAPFNSSDFELKDEDGQWRAYGIHTLNFICFDSDYKATAATRQYVESRNHLAVTDITPITKKQGSLSTGEIAGNRIKWYSINMQTGDSLALRTSGASGIDVFTPLGERCYRASGVKAASYGGFHAFSDGQYLIGIHDVIGYSTTTSLSYNHIDKYAVIATGPKRTAEADMFVLNITGNGLQYVKEASLTAGNHKYVPKKIGYTDSCNGHLIFDLTGAPEDVYDLTVVYDDGSERDEISVARALTVVAPHPGDIRVSAARSVFGTTLNDVLIQVTNTGNVPYWGIPFNIAAEADGSEKILLNFKDFIPNMPDDDINDWEMIITDNLLGTGRRGGYLPLMIPYIGPNETKEFTIVYQMPLTVHIPTYTWTGRPWSDEFKELKTMVERGEYPEIRNLNYISASTFSLAMAVVEHNASMQSTSTHNGASRAPGRYVDTSGVTNGVGLANTVADATGHDLSRLNNSATVNQHAVSTGNTIGGIEGGLRLTVTDAVIQAAGIDLSTGEYSSLAQYRSDLVQSLPDPRRIARDTWGAAGEQIIGQMLNDNGGCATSPEPMPTAADIVQMTPCDPNDITGYRDPSGGLYVGSEVKTIPYTIEFENDPTLATAPAHVIKVTDRLNPEVFDLSSFSMREVSIGRKTLKLDGGADFTATVDMRPEINSVAEISFTLNRDTGDAVWTIRTLDPFTLDPATEMIQGILPVNNDGDGCGEIQFDINLNPNLGSGLKFENSASIIFDRNDAIDTPVWENITDYDAPEARITGVTFDGTVYTFEMEASDKGAGLWTYELWFLGVGSSSWQLLRGGIPYEELTYPSSDRLVGTFCVVATDKAGNRQTVSPINALFGDANNDSLVDAADVVIIRNYFTDTSTPLNRIQADVNVDYVIDAQDAVLVSDRFTSGQKKQRRTRKYTTK